MIPKNIDAIEIADLQALIENSVAESKTIEYKKELKNKTDSDKKEFLYDVSSFANANGGDLLIGIAEDKGSPISLDGIETSDIDAEVLRIENLIRDGIAPRITGIKCRYLPVTTGKYIIVIHIPQSWNAPHQVIFQGTDKFYTRGSNGKYKLDVGELRNAFLLSESLNDKIKRFREERLMLILANETPVPLLPNPRVILHFIPLSAFRPGKRYNLKGFEHTPNILRPIGGSGYNYRHNFDGFVTFRGLDSVQKGKHNGYAQLFYNGALEFVDSWIIGIDQSGKKILQSYLEEELIRTVREAKTLITQMQIDLPIVMFLTLADVKDCEFTMDSVFSRGETERIDKNMLLLPEIFLEDLYIESDVLIRDWFDMLWNACGFAACRNYDDRGRWVKPRR